MQDTYRNKILESKQNNAPLFLESLWEPEYTWSNFIDALNTCYKPEKTLGDYVGKEVFGSVNFWSRLTVTLDSVTEKHFPGLQQKIDFLKNVTLCDFHGCFSIISFTNLEPTTGNHSDPINVIYYQTIGSAVWEVSHNDVRSRFVLKPGDAIYVPSGLMHEVTSLSPRAALSFMFADA